jgi:ABC-type lipoprotein export system ATPase subunit
MSCSSLLSEGKLVVQDDHMKVMKRKDLGFNGFKMELKAKKKNQSSRLILDGSIRGRAQPGRMLAIMGPSGKLHSCLYICVVVFRREGKGAFFCLDFKMCILMYYLNRCHEILCAAWIGAGKSSVMHALAGKVKESSRIQLEGSRYINGHAITGASQIPAAFVKQEVSFFPYMTVRETLAFRVELKLGSLISKEAQVDRVDELIQQLKLEKAVDTIVGNAKVRGISGGERRRLAIACELISSPSVIFLDEPTSGLDSTAATSLVGALRNLADSGKTIVAVIHQPSQHVFSAFDDLLLVSEGRQMYFGETSKVRQYMNKNVMNAPAEMG